MKNINNETDSKTPTNTLANELNKFFINVASDLIQQLQERKNTLTPPITILSQNNSYTLNKTFLNKFETITIDDILKAITKLKNGSSSEFDKISADILKKYNTILCKLLCHIFNLCIPQNQIPEVLKIAVITLIHKKGPNT